MALQFVRQPRARRYVLRVLPGGVARVTIPRGGCLATAREFVERQQDWLARALQRLAARPQAPAHWPGGSLIWFRGERQQVTEVENGVRLGSEFITGAALTGNWRPVIERAMQELAARELPPRLAELARAHDLRVARVTIRNQRSRWGSCSRRGTISLNWRLIQTPAFVRDYIMLHELMHLRQMNHSARFWAEVAQVCPNFRAAEQWLKQHSALLR